MREADQAPVTSAVLGPAVVVAALGYFVDIYDLILFNVVRVPSLTALGVPKADSVTLGASIFDWQMTGMLLGGVLFGVVGDKVGRLHILFASITLYSFATIANGFVGVHDFTRPILEYQLYRLLAGVGLSGELGAGVTLVTEILPARLRGYGTMLVASVGVSGAVVANLVAKHMDWRAAYFVGGGLGLSLFVFRLAVHESAMFDRVRAVSSVRRGEFSSLFTSWNRFRRYLASILIAVPIWFSNALLIAFAPEFASALGVKGPVSAGDAVMMFYTGLVFGDVISSLASQAWQSRRKVVLLFILLLLFANGLYFSVGRGASPEAFLALCGVLGFAGGYWAIFVTVAAEQFGTNIRATVATTVPNFVRGLVPVVNLLFLAARDHLGMESAAMTVGAVFFALAIWAAFTVRETFGTDLDYVEPS